MSYDIVSLCNSFRFHNLIQFSAYLELKESNVVYLADNVANITQARGITKWANVQLLTSGIIPSLNYYF